VYPEYRKIYNTFQKNIDVNAWDEITAFFTFKKAAFEEHNIASKLVLNESGSTITKDTPSNVKLIVPSYIRVANTILTNQMQNMYSGELKILGNPGIKPHDVVWVQDDYNDMQGPIEVDTVVHSFTTQSGLTTTITPALVTYQQSYKSVLDYDYLHSQFVKGIAVGVARGVVEGYFGFELGNMAKGWLDKGATAYKTLPSAIAGARGVRSAKFIGATPSLIARAKVAPANIMKLAGRAMPWLAVYSAGKDAFDEMYGSWVGGMGRLAGNNVSNFTGLWLRGQPYIAGLDGYRLNNIWASRFQDFDGKLTSIVVPLPIHGGASGGLVEEGTGFNLDETFDHI
jgi:hypothetical protein